MCTILWLNFSSLISSALYFCSVLYITGGQERRKKRVKFRFHERHDAWKVQKCYIETSLEDCESNYFKSHAEIKRSIETGFSYWSTVVFFEEGVVAPPKVVIIYSHLSRNFTSLPFEVKGQRPEPRVEAAMWRATWERERCSQPISKHMVRISSSTPTRSVVTFKHVWSVLHFNENFYETAKILMNFRILLE
jgi:hypothetical protein